MQDTNRDGLENFFKKHTEKYYFEFNEADWNKLSARLDEELRGAVVPFWKRGAWRYLVPGVLLLAVSLLVFFYINGNLAGNSGNVNSSSTVAANTPRQNQAANPTQPETTLDSEPEARDEIDRKNNQASPLSSAGIAHPNNAETTSAGDKRTPSATEDSDVQKSEKLPEAMTRGVTGSELNEQEPEKNIKTSGVDETKTSEAAIAGEDPDIEDNSEIREAPVFSTGIGKGASVSFLIPYGLTLEAITPNTPPLVFTESEPKLDESKEELIAKKLAARKLISVGFTVAPDFSSVGLADHTRPGGRYGLIVDYYFTKRLALHTGAIVANNIYTARGNQYNAPPGFWDDDEAPVSAEGKCKILDIPLNLRYDALNIGKNTLFVTGGATSYIMLNEEYTFYFRGSSLYSGNSTTYGAKNSGSHFMGLINLSIGYEGFVADRWSIQVEPFANLPLTGIGMGKVDLYSLGMYLTLKYHWKKTPTKSIAK